MSSPSSVNSSPERSPVHVGVEKAAQGKASSASAGEALSPTDHKVHSVVVVARRTSASKRRGDSSPERELDGNRFTKKARSSSADHGSRKSSRSDDHGSSRYDDHRSSSSRRGSSRYDDYGSSSSRYGSSRRDSYRSSRYDDHRPSSSSSSYGSSRRDSYRSSRYDDHRSSSSRYGSSRHGDHGSSSGRYSSSSSRHKSSSHSSRSTAASAPKASASSSSAVAAPVPSGPSFMNPEVSFNQNWDKISQDPITTQWHLNHEAAGGTISDVTSLVQEACKFPFFNQLIPGAARVRTMLMNSSYKINVIKGVHQIRGGTAHMTLQIGSNKTLHVNLIAKPGSAGKVGAERWEVSSVTGV